MLRVSSIGLCCR